MARRQVLAPIRERRAPLETKSFARGGLCPSPQPRASLAASPYAREVPSTLGTCRNSTRRCRVAEAQPKEEVEPLLLQRLLCNSN